MTWPMHIYLLIIYSKLSFYFISTVSKILYVRVYRALMVQFIETAISCHGSFYMVLKISLGVISS